VSRNISVIDLINIEYSIENVATLNCWRGLPGGWNAIGARLAEEFPLPWGIGANFAAGDSSPRGRGRKNMSLACKAKLLFFQVRGYGAGG
jgi:hypothetical protein